MKRHKCANLRVKSLRVKARVKIYTRVFCVDFSWKSAILHAMYPRVSAAMPVACTVWPAESSFFWMAVVFLMQCPHCGSCIEKNGGCNHMVCTKIQQSLSLKDSIHWERKEVEWNPVNTATSGPKKFGCYNEVTVLTRVSLQENVWAFLPGGQKKCLTTELAVRQGSTVMLSVTCCWVLQWYCSFFNLCDFQFSYFSHWFFCFVLISQQCIKCKHGMLNILRLKCITE